MQSQHKSKQNKCLFCFFIQLFLTCFPRLKNGSTGHITRSDPFLFLFFPPDHLIDHAGIGLDDLDHLGRDVLLNVVGHGYAVVPCLVHLNCGIHRLEHLVGSYARQDEVALVKSLGALGRGADAHSGERISHG